jgi:hypothetical protein
VLPFIIFPSLPLDTLLKSIEQGGVVHGPSDRDGLRKVPNNLPFRLTDESERNSVRFDCAQIFVDLRAAQIISNCKCYKLSLPLHNVFVFLPHTFTL